MPGAGTGEWPGLETDLPAGRKETEVPGLTPPLPSPQPPPASSHFPGRQAEEESHLEALNQGADLA